MQKGDIVVDTVRKRVGKVMDTANRPNQGPILILRPPRGGLEWDALVADCRPAEPSELVSVQSLILAGPMR
ncbi:hypothetical protein [Streptomyces misionensis]|uniref:hypothetical protein n=1 Tax=Streptomyces misionensis TaxID=67331 RepID=UPI00369678BC